MHWAVNYESINFEEKVLKVCPYCSDYCNNNWVSVRSHTSKCKHNNHSYFIDKNVGPISLEDISGIKNQKELECKFPEIHSRFTDIKKRI